MVRRSNEAENCRERWPEEASRKNRAQGNPRASKVCQEFCVALLCGHGATQVSEINILAKMVSEAESRKHKPVVWKGLRDSQI